MALGTPDRTAGGGHVYIGKITRVTGTTCYVEVPHVAPGFEFGPAGYPSEYHAPEETLPAGAHDHEEAVVPVALSTDGAHGHTSSTGTAGDHQHPATGDHAHTADGTLTAAADPPTVTHTHDVTGSTSTAGSHQHATAGNHAHAITTDGDHSHTATADAHTHGTDGEHVHRHRPLTAGDRVAVAFLENSHDDLVVLVRLA